MKRYVIWWALTGLCGCGRDVRLGTAPDAASSVDGTVDAPNLAPFMPGVYSLTFLDPIQTSCDGTLIGNEAMFSGITRASANLVDGTVTLSAGTATLITVSGTPITTAFGQPSIDLVPNPAASPPDFPQTIWDTNVMRDFGVGPLATLHDVRYFGIDAATAGTPAMMEAAVALFYETSDMSGYCYGVFGAALASQ